MVSRQLHARLCGCKNAEQHIAALEVLAAVMDRRITRDEALAVLDDAIRLHQGDVRILHAVPNCGAV